MSRKKKKPSHLYEVFASESDEENENTEARYSVFICKETLVKPTCFLCANTVKLCFDLGEHVEGSLTFSDLIGKLLRKEKLPHSLANKDCSHGLLCSNCRDLLKEVYRLQHELKRLKNVIVTTFKSTEPDEIDPIPESDADIVPITNKGKNIQDIAKNIENALEDDNNDEITFVRNKDSAQYMQTHPSENDNEKKDKTSLRKSADIKLIRKNCNDFGKSDDDELLLVEKQKSIRKANEDGKDFKPGASEHFLDYGLFDNIRTCIQEVEEENCRSVDEVSLCSIRSNPLNEVDNEELQLTTGSEINITRDDGGDSPIIPTKVEERVAEERFSQKSPSSNIEEDNESRNYDDVDILLDSYLEDTDDVSKDNKLECKSTTEEEYVVESLLDKQGSEYLVKWENYPTNQSTWEPRDRIPDTILEYYEANLSRLGKPIPSDDDEESEDDSADDTWKPARKKKSPKKSQKRKKKVEDVEFPGKRFFFDPPIRSDITVQKIKKKTKQQRRRKRKFDDGSNKTTLKEMYSSVKDIINAAIEKDTTFDHFINKKQTEKSTIDLLLAKHDEEFLVKWKDSPTKENTWEKRSNIPGWILNFYEKDLRRLGSSPYTPYI